MRGRSFLYAGVVGFGALGTGFGPDFGSAAADSGRDLVLTADQVGRSVYYRGMAVGTVEAFNAEQNKLKISFLNGRVELLGPKHLRLNKDGKLTVVRDKKG